MAEYVATFAFEAPDWDEAEEIYERAWAYIEDAVRNPLSVSAGLTEHVPRP